MHICTTLNKTNPAHGLITLEGILQTGKKVRCIPHTPLPQMRSASQHLSSKLALEVQSHTNYFPDSQHHSNHNSCQVTQEDLFSPFQQIRGSICSNIFLKLRIQVYLQSITFNKKNNLFCLFQIKGVQVCKSPWSAPWQGPWDRPVIALARGRRTGIPRSKTWKN